jgi:hypothetical protein
MSGLPIRISARTNTGRRIAVNAGFPRHPRNIIMTLLLYGERRR